MNYARPCGGGVNHSDALALTSEAIQRPPRERAERSYADIRRWVELRRGGHFVAAEALAEDLRAFFHPFNERAVRSE